MKNATILLAPEVDAAILRLIDYVDPSEIPDVLAFLEGIHQRVARLLSDFPESGARFQGDMRFLAFDGYTFLY